MLISHHGFIVKGLFRRIMLLRNFKGTLTNFWLWFFGVILNQRADDFVLTKLQNACQERFLIWVFNSANPMCDLSVPLSASFMIIFWAAYFMKTPIVCFYLPLQNKSQMHEAHEYFKWRNCIL